MADRPGRRASQTSSPGLRLNYRSILVVLVVLAAAVAVPLAAIGLRQMLMLLLLPAVLAGAYLLLRQPSLRFPALVITSLLVPLAIDTGTRTRVNASLLLAALLVAIWIFEMVAGRREGRLEDRPGVRPLLAFMALGLLSLGFGQIPWLPARSASLTVQLGELSVLILSPCVFLLTAHGVPNLKTLAWTVWTYIALSGVFIVCLFVPSLRAFAMQTYQRAVLDSLFWVWLVTLCVSQCLLNRHLAVRWRFILGLIALGAFYYTIVLRQTWASGWLPSVVSVAVILGIARPKWLAGIGLLLVIVALLQPSLVHELILGGDNEYSLSTRLEAWGILLEIIRLNPVLGLGPANYYAYSSLYGILGYSVSFNSHNNFIDIAAQMGLAGLACFLWFAAELGLLLLRLRPRAPDGFPQAFVIGALGGLAGTLASMMLGDWFLPFVYNVGLEGFRASGLAWMFLGGALAVERLTPSPSPLPERVKRTTGKVMRPDRAVRAGMPRTHGGD